MTSTSNLTGPQIDSYFDHIELPAQYRRDQNPALNLSFLSSIQAYHISTIPYENTALHYAKDINISLNVSDIYNKFVERHHGGYCMENNIFLNHVLRFLGFQVYLTGARLHRDKNSKCPGWSGWEHAVNIVTLQDNTRYLVDVGYGGDGPRCPLPLTPDLITRNIGTQDIRLTRNTLPDFLDTNNQNQQLWIYQFRNSTEKPWNSTYAFTEIEFLHRDFEVISFYTSKHSDCFLTTNLLVVKFLRRGDEVYGKVILEEEKFKENLGGKNVLVKTCVTEAERVLILGERFGIKLTEEEKRGIIGRVSALALV